MGNSHTSECIQYCTNVSREEDEKLNVWVALLNLENLYGSQESLVKVFQTALHQNDPLEVFRRLAAIYQESNKMAVSYPYQDVYVWGTIPLLTSWQSSCIRP